MRPKPVVTIHVTYIVATVLSWIKNAQHFGKTKNCSRIPLIQQSLEKAGARLSNSTYTDYYYY